MATKIVTKNSSTASAVPTASDLVQGELAVNVADKRLFTEDNTGTIVELGTNPSTIDINAGSIDGTAIGASSASTGAFTTLTATGIDVTGTVSADGVKTDHTDGFYIDNAGATEASWTHTAATGSSVINVGRNSSWGGDLTIKTDTKSRALFNSNGDISFYEDTGTTAKLFWDASAESLGIGTTSPSSKISIHSSAGDAYLSQTNTSNSQKLEIGNAYSLYSGASGAVSAIASDSILAFATNDSEAMRIDSSGNVGIGTSSPSRPLYVQESGTGSSRGISINTATAGGNAGIGFATAGTDRFSIDTVGSSGSEALRVYSWTASTERMRIDSSGNLLVGRTSTAGSLTDHGHQLYNSGLYYLYSSATGNSDAFRMYDGNGTLRATIDGDGDYTDLSDVRAKENIVNAPSVLSTINDLQVRSFTWKVDGKHQTYGFVAQELNEAIPEAVSLPEEEDGMWGVKHAKLVPVLVKAIQEQQTLIESLTDRIAALEE